MMGEHLIELDPEPDIIEAFSCFDEGDKGVVSVQEMRKWLGEYGDRMDDREVSKLGITDGLANQRPEADYRLNVCSAVLLQTDKDASTTLNSQKSCESMTARRNATTSLHCDMRGVGLGGP